MTIPIKIECECGQHYAFDVEPVNNLVPAPVACPACGADGTATANAILAQRLQTQPPAAAAATPLRVTLPANPAPSATTAAPVRTAEHRGASLRPGQTTRTQALHEARAKMLWGDPPLQVMAYLMTQGFSREEASELMQEFLKERVRTIRGKGLRYVCIGGALVAVTALIFLGFYLNNHMPRSRAIGVLAVVGLFGLWLLIKGIVLLVSPKSEAGDASEEVDTGSWLD